MKILFFIIGLFSLIDLNAQDPLTFSEIGFDHAHCRTAGFQNGNGIVYASVEGGVPPYTYIWTSLTTGATSTNTAWGGLNAGDYKIKVTDFEGDFICDTVRVDSINPIAIMSVIGDFIEGPDYYMGDAPLSITFENNSENVSDAVFPDTDARYFFRPRVFLPYTTATVKSTDFEYTYNYDGIWTAWLIAKNRNGCVDTARATFMVNGTVSIEESLNSENITVYSVADNAIQVTIPIFNDNSLLFNLYSLNGALIESVPIDQEITVIENLSSNTIYLYELVDSESFEVKKTGKIVL